MTRLQSSPTPSTADRTGPHHWRGLAPAFLADLALIVFARLLLATFILVAGDLAAFVLGQVHRLPYVAPSWPVGS